MALPNSTRSKFAAVHEFLFAAVAADHLMPLTRLPGGVRRPVCTAPVGMDSSASVRSSRTMRRAQPRRSSRAVERTLKDDSLLTARLLATALRPQSAHSG